ncbi:hypothetical protein [Candidatus Ichthyocystis hellenicum]|uniref:hypothetical protein n=1 Tax=Candidatus Ichthyocystis hellenicum TaxID=1561003 RepID=UPI000B8189C2|nr:hypothetical protein [Candidatus Ichthyocystis hellenicum]
MSPLLNQISDYPPHQEGEEEEEVGGNNSPTETHSEDDQHPSEPPPPYVSVSYAADPSSEGGSSVTLLRPQVASTSTAGGNNSPTETHSEDDQHPSEPPPYASVSYVADRSGEGSSVTLLRSQGPSTSTAGGNNGSPANSTGDEPPPPYEVALYLPGIPGNNSRVAPLRQRPHTGAAERRGRSSTSPRTVASHSRNMVRQGTDRRVRARLQTLFTKLAFALAFCCVLLSLGFIIGISVERRRRGKGNNCTCPPSNSSSTP